MKVTVDRINECMAMFVKGYMVPNAKKLSTKFKLGYALGSGGLVLDQQMVDGMKALGIADADGNVDLDKMKAAVYAGIDAAGEMPIEKLGVGLTRPEVDRLFGLIETGALS